MTDKETRERFRDVFLKEWQLFLADSSSASEDERDTISKSSSRGKSARFDPNPKAGELRLFVWDGNPLLALLYKEMEDAWIILPVSEFTVPATEQEILLSRRVYQLWNSFTASKGFVERSWLVDSLPKQDMDDLCNALLHVLVGDPLRDDLLALTGMPITSVEDPRLDYERAFAAGPIVEKLRLGGLDVEQVGRLRLPHDFFLAAIREEIPFRLAAATDDDASFMLILEGTSEEDIRKTCVECDLVSPFRSINPDDEPYTYVFRPKSLPDGWKGNGDIPVQARNRETLEIVGEGALEAASGEIAIRTTGKVRDAIEKPEQMVLVMSRSED